VPLFSLPLPDERGGSSRLIFARWLVDKKSPTTARVAVNRFWQAYFGTGIVTTPEDFGMQSEAPSPLSCSIGWRELQAPESNVQSLESPT
jgi:hypothetical protein